MRIPGSALPPHFIEGKTEAQRGGLVTPLQLMFSHGMFLEVLLLPKFGRRESDGNVVSAGVCVLEPDGKSS